MLCNPRSAGRQGGGLTENTEQPFLAALGRGGRKDCRGETAPKI